MNKNCQTISSLDINDVEFCQKWKDQRLESRLLINQKVSELITTVLSTLKDTNSTKIHQIIELAKNPSTLKKMLCKPHIQNFIASLKSHSFFNNCNSFVLTQPLKLQPQHLEIRTPSGVLEDLVSFIRANALQYPRKSFEELEVKSLTDCLLTPRAVGASVESAESQLFLLRPRESKSVSFEQARFRHSSQNFIAKNIAAIGNYQKHEIEAKVKNWSRTSFSKTKTSKMRK